MFRVSRAVWILMLASLLVGSMVGVGAVAAYHGGNGAPKVDICHVPSGNPDNVKLINISGKAVANHIAKHGDYYQGSYYPDTDGDSYGDQNAVSLLSCTQPDGLVGNSADCNDSAADVNPGAAEVCGDDIDNNCNGEVDEGCGPVACETFEGGATSCHGGWYSASCLHSAHVDAHNNCLASCAGTCTLRSGFQGSWTPEHLHGPNRARDGHRHATEACIVDGCIDPIQ